MKIVQVMQTPYTPHGRDCAFLALLEDGSLKVGVLRQHLEGNMDTTGVYSYRVTWHEVVDAA